MYSILPASLSIQLPRLFSFFFFYQPASSFSFIDIHHVSWLHAVSFKWLIQPTTRSIPNLSLIVSKPRPTWPRLMDQEQNQQRFEPETRIWTLSMIWHLMVEKNGPGNFLLSSRVRANEWTKGVDADNCKVAWWSWWWSLLTTEMPNCARDFITVRFF